MFQQFVASDNGDKIKQRITPYREQVLMVIPILSFVHCFSFLSVFLFRWHFLCSLFGCRENRKKENQTFLTCFVYLSDTNWWEF